MMTTPSSLIETANTSIRGASDIPTTKQRQEAGPDQRHASLACPIRLRRQGQRRRGRARSVDRGTGVGRLSHPPVASLCNAAGGRHAYGYASDQRSPRPRDKFPARHRYRRCGRTPASESRRRHQRPGTGRNRARRIVDRTGVRFSGAAGRRVAQPVGCVDQRPGVRRISGIAPTSHRALPVRLRARRRPRRNRCGAGDLG